MIKKKKPNVERVFQDLQLKDLINKKRKLIANSSESNFRSEGNKIIYNPLFANLNKNSLRYILLHEEAHNKQFQNSTWILILCILLPTGVYYYSNNSLITFISFFLPIFIFRKFIGRDEFKADLWSAERLKKFYKIKHPSKIMEETIKEYRKNINKKNFLSKVRTITGKIIWYHPQYEKRVKLVKERIG